MALLKLRYEFDSHRGYNTEGGIPNGTPPSVLYNHIFKSTLTKFGKIFLKSDSLRLCYLGKSHA